jgi:hypothetical protein
MIVDMAEEKRQLVWIQTAFFMGWGCSACTWRGFIPRDVPTLVAPSPESREGFKQHRCEGALCNDGDERTSYGRAHHKSFQKF